ncbi:hypothetical protein AK830_g1889 [Neonectria ditissima]|uniref:Uncharacterized protein n=1 Tax=Neonectria ditissima TaxID=78410 RepID=A0A0P7BH03_9HYPO|nr:hypothetical protein AK830_g1889 [Neonectria ditissima]
MASEEELSDVYAVYMSPEDVAPRHNLLIKPSDADWKQVHDNFTWLLGPSSTKTINEIMKDTFTRHEARMFVRSNRPDIKSIQDSNASRFRNLLHGRFSGVNGSLVTKFTMMYFGLPVEPMTSLLDELAEQVGQKPSEGPFYEIAPPLHFLTANNHRNMGDDALRGKGGGASPEPEPPVVERDYFPLREEPFEPTDKWKYLYGLKGAIPMVPNKWKTFAAAVRTLLCRRTNDNTPVKFRLIFYDKKNEHKRIPIDDYLPITEESTAMKYLIEHWESSSDHENCCEYFVKLAPKNNASAFLQASEKWLDDVPHWEPYENQFKSDVFRFSFPVFDKYEEPKREIRRHAWLAFPKPKPGKKFSILDYGANQYNAQLRTAIEVIIGRPVGDFHHAMFRLHDMHNPTASEKWHFVYGGMAQHTSVWERMNPQTNPDGDWVLQSRLLGSEDTAVVIPHYYPPFVPIIKKDDIDGGLLRLRQLLASAYTAHDIRKMDWVKLSPGRTLFGMDAVAIAGLPLKHVNPPNRRIAPRPPHDSLAPTREGSEEDEDEDDEDSYIDRNRGCKEYDYATSEEDELDFLDRDREQAKVHAQDLNLRDLNEVPDTNLDPDDSRPLPLLDEEFYSPGDQLRDILEVEEKVIVLSPVWSTHKSRLIPGWLDAEVASRKTVTNLAFDELAVRSYDVTSVFQSRIDHLCDTAGRQRINHDRRVICLRSAWPEGSSHDAPLIAVGGESTHHQFQGIHASLTHSRVTVTFKVKKAGSWNKSLHFSNVWGPRVLTECECAEAPWIPPPVDDEEDENEEPERERGPRRSPSPEFTAPEAPEEDEEEDMAAGGVYERSITWYKQPSLFDDNNNNAKAQVPINAPPKEPMLRTTSNLPMVSKAVLTTTEATRLVDLLWQNRNEALDRARTCPYRGCEFSYRTNDVAAIEKHFRDRHRASKCMWCNETLFEHWDYEQKMAHLRSKHEDQMLHALGGTGQPRRGTSASNVRTGSPERGTSSFGIRTEPPRRRTSTTGVQTDLSEQGTPRRRGTSTTGVPTEPPREFPSDGKCRLFFTCETNVRDLDDRQFVEHMHDWHQDYLDSDKPVWELRRDWVDADKSAEKAKGKGKASQAQAPALRLPSTKTRAGPSTQEDDLEELPSFAAEDTSDDATVTPSPKRTRQPSARREASAVSSNRSESRSQARGKSSGKRPAKRSRVSREPAETPESDDDAGTSPTPRGRPRQQESAQVSPVPEEREEEDAGVSKGGQVLKRRRYKSVDWVEKLGPDDPDFEPSDDMYCSKCLRKAPKHRDQSPGRSMLGRSKELEFHYAKDRCCRIRRGVGSALGLPNRSGWIPASNLPKRITLVKEKFLTKFPAYVQTIYPTRVTDVNTTVWRSDPNNDTNNQWWDIPWPPYEGQPPFPGAWTFPGYPEVDGSGRKRRREFRGVPGPSDPTYQYVSDHDSDDGLEADVDDTQEFREAEIEARGGSKTPRKKAPEDFVVESVESEESSSEPAPKKARKTKKKPAAAGPAGTEETVVKSTPKKTKKTPAAEPAETENTPAESTSKKSKKAPEPNPTDTEDTPADPAPKKTKPKTPTAKPTATDDTPTKPVPKKTQAKTPAPEATDTEDTIAVPAPKSTKKKTPVPAPVDTEDSAPEPAPKKTKRKQLAKEAVVQTVKTEEVSAGPTPKKTTKKQVAKAAAVESVQEVEESSTAKPAPKKGRKRQRPAKAVAESEEQEEDAPAGPSPKKMRRTKVPPQQTLSQSTATEDGTPLSSMPTRASSRIRAAREASAALSAKSKK